MGKPTTGKISTKNYACTGCCRTRKFDTNHWGSIYPRCDCGAMRWTCLDPCPETHEKPEEWRTVTLGEILAPAVCGLCNGEGENRKSEPCVRCEGTGKAA